MRVLAHDLHMPKWTRTTKWVVSIISGILTSIAALLTILAMLSLPPFDDESALQDNQPEVLDDQQRVGNT